MPLHTADGDDADDLLAYLRGLAEQVDDVLVVDGSASSARRAHAAVLEPHVRVLAPRASTPNGKVGNVLTGLAVARHDQVIIADDDVRYRPEQLEALLVRLRHADVVRPQNYFHPLPWHARVDTTRTLLARVSGGDWPGTLAVRRSVVLAAGGYAGDVLFENLELVRTVLARGGREQLALDVNVRRVPPSSAHFRGQQVRQAYDEFARPVRFLLSLAIAPGVVCAVRAGRGTVVGGAAIVASLSAEIGRRRAGGREVFPASSTLLAPPWLLWRSLCSWVAVGARLRGGARYRGTRLRSAATPRRVLRRKLRDGASSPAWSGRVPAGRASLLRRCFGSASVRLSRPAG